MGEIKMDIPDKINFYKMGYGFGIINSSTSDFQEFCLEIQAETEITLSGSSPERYKVNSPAWVIWESFHEGRNA